MGLQEEIMETTGMERRDAIFRMFRDRMSEGSDYIRRGEKMTLLKGGAELLLQEFSLTSQSFIAEERKGKNEMFVFETRIFQDGKIVGNGFGSCSTSEIDPERKDARATNSAIKIAKKRSFVDAVLTATGASSLFTQDLGEELLTGPAKITQNQVKYIKRLIESGNIEDDVFRAFLRDFDAESMEDLNRSDASKVIGMILQHLRQKSE
ncbi:MAG: hypothetical protein LVQ96_03150 [Thermoplasmatales archaeon]|nr:hypothetical protein [Thermoplasmatales archaeon]MCW6170146.1 hypothetical protein [Thermoplasmatales archaeon]